MRVQDKVRAMKNVTKGQAPELPVPKRTGSVLVPDELATPEKSLEYLTRNKEQAKPAKA